MEWPSQPRSFLSQHQELYVRNIVYDGTVLLHLQYFYTYSIELHLDDGKLNANPGFPSIFYFSVRCTGGCSNNNVILLTSVGHDSGAVVFDLYSSTTGIVSHCTPLVPVSDPD